MTTAPKSERLSPQELTFADSLISGDCRPSFKLAPGSVREAMIKARRRTGLRLGFDGSWNVISVTAHAMNKKGEPTGLGTVRILARTEDPETFLDAL